MQHISVYHLKVIISSLGFIADKRPLLYLLALAPVLDVDLGQVVVAVLGDRNHIFIFNAAHGMLVHDPELRETPLGVEVSGQHRLHETEHALRVVGRVSTLLTGFLWNRHHLLVVSIHLAQLFLTSGCQRHVPSDCEDVDGAFVRGAAHVLGHRVKCDVEHFGVVTASAQFLNLFARLRVEDSDQCALQVLVCQQMDLPCLKLWPEEYRRC